MISESGKEVGMFEQQQVPVRCFACGTSFHAEARRIIDVGEHPGLTTLFLTDQLNVAVCPTCGTEFPLAVPIVYHDPDREFLGVYIPPEAEVTELQQHQQVGELTNALINRIPPERRKAYLLQPRQFLTLESMKQAIMEMEGLSREMIEEHRQRAQLLERMVEALDVPERLQAIVAANEERIDEVLFDMISRSIEFASAHGASQLAQQFERLYDALMEMSYVGRRLRAQQEIMAKFGERGLTREDVLEQLVNVTDDAVIEAWVMAARPLMDYFFFQMLTDRIERAERRRDQTTAQRLKALRERVLEIQRREEAALQEAVEEAEQLLKEAMESEDPKAVLQAHKEKLTSLFLSLLISHMQEAEEEGNFTLFRRLREINRFIAEIIEEEMPPDVRLVYRLLRSEYPQETREVLQEYREHLSPKVLETIEEMAQTFRERGEESIAKHLENVRTQAALLL